MSSTKKRLEAYATKMRDIDNYTHDDKQSKRQILGRSQVTT